MRYPDGNGLETNSLQAGPQLTRRLNALNSISGQYSYSRFSYIGSTVTMETQTAQFSYTRTWTRRLTTSAGAGPEWIQSSTSIIPSSTGLSANANGSYAARTMTATLGYSRATPGGAGVANLMGVHNDDIYAGLSHQQGRNLTFSATGGYMRTRGLLQSSGVTNGKFGGLSATRQCGRYIVIFANYTATQQFDSSALPSTAISGLSHVVGFGLGYSPREVHLRK